jgi:hypothetical protein
MLLAGLGWLAGGVLFSLLYWRAYALRAWLDLNPLEVFMTWEELENWGLAVGVTLVALGSLLAVPASRAVWTLAVYFLYFPLRLAHHAVRRRQYPSLAAPDDVLP